MSRKKKINNITEETQKHYEKQAMNQWGEDRVTQSTKLWNSYGEDKKESIMEECYSIFEELSKFMQYGPESKEVQNLLIKWHHFILYFYEPSLEVLRGLGEIYDLEPEFRKFFEVINPDLPDFLHSSINYYVDELEMKWLESQYEVLQE